MKTIAKGTALSILQTLGHLFNAPNASAKAPSNGVSALRSMQHTPVAFTAEGRELLNQFDTIEKLSITVNGLVSNEQLHGLVRLSAATDTEISSKRSGTGQTFMFTALG